MEIIHDNLYQGMAPTEPVIIYDMTRLYENSLVQTDFQLKMHIEIMHVL